MRIRRKGSSARSERTSNRGHNNTPTDAAVLARKRHAPRAAVPADQKNLTIAPADSAAEREADLVADHVMRSQDSYIPAVVSAPESNGAGGEKVSLKPLIQRVGVPTNYKCLEGDDEKSKFPIQRAEISSTLPTVTPEITQQVKALEGRGNKLNQSDRVFFAERMPRVDTEGVRIHTDSSATQLARSIDARAFTYKNHVVMGQNEYQAGSSSTRRLLAHELTHTVQQTGGVQRKGAGHNTPTSYSHSVGPQIQRFAPPGHRRSTIAGLKRNFSAEEIGLVSQKNWERDFAQTSGDIGNLVLAWRLLKSAWKKPPKSEEDAKAVQEENKKLAQNFRSAVRSVLNMGMFDAQDESLGGSRPWHHFDRVNAKEANKRWKVDPQKDKIMGPIRDSRAFVKDLMVRSVQEYRKVKFGAADRFNKVGGKAFFDNWVRDDLPGTAEDKKATRPKGYNVKKTSDYFTPFSMTKMNSTKVIAEITEKKARQAGARKRGKPSKEFRAAADPLGRASHAIEDFFAHSNWLLSANRKLKGESEVPLRIGLFEQVDQVDAIANKIKAIARLMNRDLSFVQEVFDVSKDSGDNKKSRMDETDNEKLRDLNFVNGRPWYLYIPFLPGSLKQIIHADWIKRNMQDYWLTSRGFLELLCIKGNSMIEFARKELKGSKNPHHATSSQDQSGNSFRERLELGAHANILLLGPLRAIMDIKDPDEARKQVQKLLPEVDKVIGVAEEDHPLWWAVKLFSKPGTNYTRKNPE